MGCWKTKDFLCQDCETEFEEFYHSDEEDELECPNCGSKNLKTLVSATGLATFSIMSPEAKRDSLKKRSEKHTQREVDREPEKWGDAGKARATKKIQVGSSGGKK